jgi:HSP20 family molecular chaperone IbpA
MNTNTFKSLFPTIVQTGLMDEKILDSILATHRKSQSFRIFEKEENWELKVPFPGATKDCVDVSISSENKLVIKVSGADFWEKEQTRKFNLPSDCDVDNIDGQIENGILTLFIPKKKSLREKTVKIK